MYAYRSMYLYKHEYTIYTHRSTYTNTAYASAHIDMHAVHVQNAHMSMCTQLHKPPTHVCIVLPYTYTHAHVICILICRNRNI